MKCLIQYLLFSVAFLLVCSASAETRPSFIFFITDDISQEDLSPYGNAYAQTPNLAKLAQEGMRFDNAYLTISSCSPSRCSMITSRYPHNTGAPELHTQLPKGLDTFPLLLKKAGYYTALSGKHHMGKAVDPGFDLVSKGKGPGKEEDWISILQNRPKDKPFFFWFASSDAHRNWSFNDDAPVYIPDDAPVPPYMVNNAETRKDLADYYHEVSRTDTYVGKLRKELKAQNIEGNTYVIYLADNGRPFPRDKVRLYNSGIKTPLIISCPGRLKPGISQSLVSSIDIGPTILDLAGVKKSPQMQGLSFMSVLKDPKATVRDFVFAEHNWHVHQAHERMVRWGPWVYIRNAWPHLQSMCVEQAPKFPAAKALWDAEAAGTLKAHQRDIFLKPRSAQELYHVGKDPFQLENVASNKGNAKIIKKLDEVLNQWVEQTGDTIPENPTNDREDAYGKKDSSHKRGTMPGDERNATKINHPGPIRE